MKLRIIFAPARDLPELLIQVLHVLLLTHNSSVSYRLRDPTDIDVSVPGGVQTFEEVTQLLYLEGAEGEVGDVN